MVCSEYSHKHIHKQGGHLVFYGVRSLRRRFGFLASVLLRSKGGMMNVGGLNKTTTSPDPSAPQSMFFKDDRAATLLDTNSVKEGMPGPEELVESKRGYK